MKIALVSAPYDTNLYRIGETLGIKYLASLLLENNFEVDVFEPTLMNLNIKELHNLLTEKEYDIIGFSIMFDASVNNVARAVKNLRDSSYRGHITLGGHVPSLSPEEILLSIPGADSIVLYEGEETLLDLSNTIKQGKNLSNVDGLAYRENNLIRKTNLRKPIENLDTLPFPLRDKLSMHLGYPHFFMISSRGCPYSCSFCSVTTFYQSAGCELWRCRSISNLIEEINFLINKFGATTISFLDDEFLVNKFARERAKKFAKTLIEQNLKLSWSIECRCDDVDEILFSLLKESGLRHVFLGIESGVQSVLDRFNKNTTVYINRNAVNIIRKLGISLAVGFIMFDPYTTIGEVKENIDFLDEMQIVSYTSLATKLKIYKGTPIFSLLYYQKRLKNKGFEYDFNFNQQNVYFVYNAFLNSLRPYYKVEIELKKLEFLSDNYVIPSKSNILDKEYNEANTLNKKFMLELLDYSKQIIKSIELNRFMNNKKLRYLIDDIKNQADISSTILNKKVKNHIKFIEKNVSLNNAYKTK